MQDSQEVLFSGAGAVIGWITAAVAGLYLLDRLGLWMERRGWLYYRYKKGSGSALGDPMLQLHRLIEPGAEHLLKAREERHHEEHTGEPPVPGGSLFDYDLPENDAGKTEE